MSTSLHTQLTPLHSRSVPLKQILVCRDSIDFHNFCQRIKVKSECGEFIQSYSHGSLRCTLLAVHFTCVLIKLHRLLKDFISAIQSSENSIKSCRSSLKSRPLRITLYVRTSTLNYCELHVRLKSYMFPIRTSLII